MTFQDAVRRTPSIREHYRAGLGALKERDRKRVYCPKSRHLSGSVDLDVALREVFPRHARWDYAIGVSVKGRAHQVTWLEVHPASSLHVDEVLDKLRWLREWMRADAQVLSRLQARFVWLASGSVAFASNSPQRRKIAQQGLLFRAGQLRLDH